MHAKTILSAVILVSIILLIVSIIQNSFDMVKAQRRLSDAQTKVKQLQKQKQELFFSQNKTQSSDFLEKQIRDKLKLVKPGEALVVLPSTLQNKSEEKLYKYHTGEEMAQITTPTWQLWWQLFF